MTRQTGQETEAEIFAFVIIDCRQLSPLRKISHLCNFTSATETATNNDDVASRPLPFLLILHSCHFHSATEHGVDAVGGFRESDSQVVKFTFIDN